MPQSGNVAASGGWMSRVFILVILSRFSPTSPSMAHFLEHAACSDCYLAAEATSSKPSLAVGIEIQCGKAILDY
ncbi:hypothetical protein BDQ94DRAFT_135913 [Aspergillus welwitschiae]|uniref:Uncharacterized protein n=1 Tax=Aspergillus welwitschiae TaxID=1341132 RepID=A0A3F3QH20_9EURO|nr:hypothetical protein BDQ94DRAFT_135913 [Aspergillus welwitschiae]RDH38239.1 hypothetical protein BDQ94DRAFT_135913 [Aspergillus welwitschiae]